MTFLLVGIGGACGSLVRFILGKMISNKSKHAFPLGTLIINVTGAMLLGFISNIPLSRSLLLCLADGFLGAYTTFSTFMYEGFNLIHCRKHLNAIAYIGGSLLSGLIFYFIGMLTANALNVK